MWHPKDEESACCELAAFVEWLRAMRGDDGISPETLVDWYAAEPSAFCDAMANYGHTNKIAAATRAAAMIEAWKVITRPA